MKPQEYLEFVASQLVEEIRPSAGLTRLTSNSKLLGAYTEAAVRRLVARVVSPLQVSTGSVTDVELSASGEDLPDLDTIVWAPCPAPAILTVGEFGLVPRSSCFGFLEIKRSLYSDVPKKLRERTEEAFIRKYVSDASRSSRAGLGVVCVKLRNQSFSPIQDLLTSGRAVVLFEEEDAGWKPRPVDVVRLVNCLTCFRSVANKVLGTIVLNEKLLTQ